MYADDTQLYLKIASSVDIQSLNSLLLETQSWLTQNHLKLNALKTEFLLISPHKQSPDMEQWLNQLTALNCRPHLVDSASSLGIILDKNLSMQKHISSLNKGANYKLSILRKLKPFLPAHDLKVAVQALVIAKLDYGSATLCGLPRASTAPLRVAFNSAARLITGSKKYNHISPDLLTLKWLPYEARIQLKIACMAHKAIHFKTPLYLAQKLELSCGTRASRSANTLLLKPQKFKKKKDL